MKAEIFMWQHPHIHPLGPIITILPHSSVSSHSHLFIHLSSHKSILLLRQITLSFSALQITSDYTASLSGNFRTCFTMYIFTWNLHSFNSYFLTVNVCEVLGKVLRMTLR